MGSTFGVDGVRFVPIAQLDSVSDNEGWGDQVNGCLTEEDVEKEIELLKESVNEQA